MWRSILLTTFLLGFGGFTTPNNRQAGAISLRSNDFVEFKHLNEFNLFYPKKWVIETGGGEECHLDSTRIAACTFAYLYNHRSQSTKPGSPLDPEIKTDIGIEFEPIDLAKIGRFKKFRIGGRTVYREQSVVPRADREGYFTRMLTTYIPYKNRVIQLNTFFEDRRSIQLIERVHNSFRILR